MKTKFTLKSTILSALLILSSCGTVKYSEDVSQNDYGNLQSGRKYSFTTRDGKSSQRMIFSNTTESDIVGYVSKKDSTQVVIAKSNVAEVRDTKKTGVVVVAVGLATAATAALVLSGSRATK